MAIHDQQFYRDLYTEHLEEASYFYATRVAWLTDAEVGWLDLERLDEGLEAHLDALVVGELLALQVCLEALEEADFDTLHVIVRLLCRHQAIENLAKLWEGFDFSDRQKVRAAADAFRWECPSAWFGHLIKVFQGGRPAMFPVLAPSVAQSRQAAAGVLAAALPRAQSADLPTLVHALMQMPDAGQQCSQLAVYTRHPEADVSAAALLALSRLGDPRALAHCRAHPLHHALLLSVSGQAEDGARLVTHAEAALQNPKPEKPEQNLLVALGLSGNLAALPLLLRALNHPDLAPQAALALHLITGAPLYEDVLIPHEMTEDELFEHEREAFARGELPKHLDDQPFGDEVAQLTQTPDKWREWISQHESAWQPQLRYRRGQPVTPLVLVQELADQQFPQWLREWVAHEWVIRYQPPVAFVPDDWVSRQKQQLNALHQWALPLLDRWPPGAWHGPYLA